MKTLTDEQKRAAYHAGSVCVIASAGTGKTTVLTERFVHCHQNLNVPLQNLLAFTFTEKAAHEMQERILTAQSMALSDLPLLKISTLHAFCAKILRQQGHKIGCDPNFKVLNAGAEKIARRSAIENHLQSALNNHDHELIEAYRHFGYKTLLEIFDKTCEFNLLSIPTDKRICQTQQEHPEMFSNLLRHIESWQAQQLQNRIQGKTLSFDDLEVLTVRLLDNHPDILENLQKRFFHILVDEAQDLSHVEHELLRKLHNPKTNTLFIVGDPKQSIYSFRRSESRVFFELQDQITKANGITVTLHHTFRTPKDQQENFNTVFPILLNSKNPDFFEPGVSHNKTLHANFYHQVMASNDDEDSASGLETKQLVEIIKQLQKTGCKTSEIAIISVSRTHFASLSDALTAHHIPCVINKKIDILHVPVVSILANILKCLDESPSRLDLAQVLRHDFFGLTPEELEHLANDDFFTHKPDGSREKCMLFWKNRPRWQNAKDTLTPNALCEKICLDLQLVQNPEDLYYLERFLDTLKSWSTQGFSDFSDIIALLKTAEQHGIELENPQNSEAGVNLLTIHGAKGLEFKHVILWPGSQKKSEREIFLFDPQKGFLFKSPRDFANVSLNEDLQSFEDFSELKEILKNENLEELKRLVYVALTRTKKNLYIFSGAPSKKLKQALTKNPQDLSVCKSYNDVLYALGGQPFAKPLSTFFEEAFENDDLPQNGSNSDVLPPNKNFTPSKPLWTVTEIETFAECPRFFFYRYLKGWVLPNSAQTRFLPEPRTFLQLSGLQKGNFLHEVLQFYSPRRNNLRDVVAQTLFNQHLKIPLDDVVQSTEDWIEKLKNHREIWECLYENQAAQNEVSFTLELNSLVLTGQIDKIIKQDSGWMVIDYKTHTLTATNDKHELARRFSFQLKCYALAVRKLFQQDTVRAALIFTQTQDWVVFEFTRHDLDEFAKSLENLHKLFRNNLGQTFSHTETRALCDDCTYLKNQVCDVKLTNA